MLKPQFAVPAAGEGYPPGDAAELFCRGQDPDRAGSASRGQHRRLAGDTVRAAMTDKVKDLRREASALKGDRRRASA